MTRDPIITTIAIAALLLVAVSLYHGYTLESRLQDMANKHDVLVDKVYSDSDKSDGRLNLVLNLLAGNRTIFVKGKEMRVCLEPVPPHDEPIILNSLVLNQTALLPNGSIMDTGNGRIVETSGLKINETFDVIT